MALGATTYKTPNIINQIGSDMTSREGCGVYLNAANWVNLATNQQVVPYGIIVTGTDSLTPGSYPSAIGDAALELVDQLGCVVQVLISASGSVYAGDWLAIDPYDADGSFIGVNPLAMLPEDWVWGYALTEAAAGEQCLMRFQPYVIQYIAP
jgi:hypothetical protein